MHSQKSRQRGFDGDEQTDELEFAKKRQKDCIGKVESEWIISLQVVPKVRLTTRSLINQQLDRREV
jgi:hypothetical protein